MIRNFFRHLWESIKSLKRNVWMTVASVSSVTITLTLVGVFAAVLLNVERIATGIENNIQINVYLDVDSTDSSEQLTKLVKQSLMIRITKFMTKFQKFQVLNQLLIQVKMNNLKNYKKPTEMIGHFLMVTQIHCKTFTLLRQTHHQM